MTAFQPVNVLLGGLSTFNMDHGFSEALVRGMRSGFLRDADYHHLTQCETLEVSLTV
jgi:V-type H+-transporting ATPase subunit d